MKEKKIYLFEQATGEIPYTLLNDYMFHVVIQENEEVLRGLTCAMLQIQKEDIKEIHVENPIIPGKAIDDKEFILDIRVLLNGDTHINYELQIINEGNWADRSLSYLCRSFDHLYRGQDYSETSKAIHIGILDFTLFEDAPEFYSQYVLSNVKNHRIYNDKFKIHVLELNQIDMATLEDKRYHLDKWAALFKSKTWEDLRMLTNQYEELKTVSEKLYVYNADKDMQQRCEAREQYLLEESRKMKKMAKLEQELKEQKEAMQEKDDELQQKDDELQQKDDALKKQQREIEKQQNEIQEKDDALQEKDETISKMEQKLREMGIDPDSLK